MKTATILAMVALGAALTACVTDSNRCFPGSVYAPQYDACLQIADGGPDGGAALDASAPSTDGAAAAEGGAGLGDSCNGNGDCALSMSTFAKVMERADIVLFSMDPSGVTTMSDGKGLERLGHKPGKRVGKNELEATRGTPAHDCLLRALNGEAVRATVEPAPGVFFDTWYMPLRNENNEADGVLGMASTPPTGCAPSGSSP